MYIIYTTHTHTHTQELELCQSEASARTDEIKTLKRENRKRRKMIEAYQDMLNQGATGLHPVSQINTLRLLLIKPHMCI